MTVEDHSGGDDSMTQAEEEPEDARREISSEDPQSARVQEGASLSHADRLWEERFEELKGFYRVHEHVRITKTNAPSVAFYRWLVDQRVNQRQGKLSAERQERLDSLGFQWLAPGRIASGETEHHEAVWSMRYSELRRFKERHGHCDVEMDWEEDPCLGRWVHRQRGAFKRGKLRPRRVELLERIGFAWESEELYRRNMWETHFNEMADYIRQHGNDRMTQSKEPARGLYHWAFHQRLNFLRGKLLPERRARLEAIGFTFGEESDGKRLSALDELWEMRFAELLRFKEQHGHASVPTDLKENRKLCHWAASQRHLNRKGKLSAERTKRLDAVGFTWTMTHLDDDQIWDEHFERFLEFKRVHGHDIVAERDDPVLYIWRRDQRKYFRRGTLSPERVARLNAIGFGWTTTVPDRPDKIAKDDAAWNEKFSQLKAFIDRHGHPLVTRSYSESLEHWMKKQRERQRVGKLRADRKQRLDEVGFVWQVVSDGPSPELSRKSKPVVDNITLWEQGFAALREFLGKHGHLNIPDKEPAHRGLAAWLRKQRIGHKRGRLLFSQASRLEELGVRWK